MEQQSSAAATRRVSIIFAVFGAFCFLSVIANLLFVFQGLSNQMPELSDVGPLRYLAACVTALAVLGATITSTLALVFAGSIFIARARYEWQYMHYLLNGGTPSKWWHSFISRR